jgi:hypothetical protein
MSTTTISRPAPPAEGTCTIDTTVVDGRAYALLKCARCSWYAYNVSSRGVTSRIGDLFQFSDLDDLIVRAIGHECPPEVRDAAAA